MVIFSKSAIADLRDILYGLIYWKKHPLSFEHAQKYVDELTEDAKTICTKSFHKNAVYSIHKQYGEKVYLYRRNKNTIWYIIYDWDKNNCIAYINRIISNYKTISEIL